MRKIIYILLVLIASIQAVEALPFNYISGTAGSIGNGNGFFDDETSLFNLTADRNIYVISEPDQIYIVDPIGYPQGESGATTLVTKGGSSFKYAFVSSDGYLYFVDSDGIKKKKSRNTMTVSVANDTTIYGSVLTIFSSANINMIYEFESKIYFIDGTTLKYFSVPDYQIVSVWTGITQGEDFRILRKSGEFTLIVSDAFNRDQGAGCRHPGFQLLSSNASVKNSVIRTGEGACQVNAGSAYSSVVVSTNYIYTNAYATNTPDLYAREEVYYISNYSLASSSAYVTPINIAPRSFSLGGFSSVVLYSKTATTYDTFNFIESGISFIIIPVASTPSEDLLSPLSNLSNQIISVDSDGDGVISDIEIKSTGNKFIPILFLLVALILIVGTYNKLTGKR